MRKAGKVPRDRLSRLPDPVIYHILSFLDTKLAVQTSVLSRAWRCAWKNVPVLDLCSKSFKRFSSFQRFVDKVFSLRDPVNVHKVSYSSRKECSKKQDDRQSVRDIIQYCLRHGAQHLAIALHTDTDLDYYYQLSDLFGSKFNCNLNTLEMEYVWIDSGFRPVGFRMLTTLKLDWCVLEYDSKGKEKELDLFSGFPCLQHLAVTDCFISFHYRDEICFKVSGLQLLSLDLERKDFCKYEVSAPKLKSLHFKEDMYFRSDFSELSVTLPSLDHADVCVSPGKDADAKKWMEQYLIPLFQGLHNVKSLTLHSKTIQVLNDFDEFLEQQRSPFTRLVHLNVRPDKRTNNIHSTVANYFLKSSSSAKEAI